jgi:hypothetical protein
MAFGEDTGEESVEHALLADDHAMELESNLLETNVGKILRGH